jgi:protein-S-isoprenylcysteine O-methyltransferase Ste14
MRGALSALELKMSPVILCLLFAAGMWWVSRSLPGFDIPAALRLAVCLLFFIVAGGIGLAGIWSFRKARTTVNPFRPQNCSALVRSGIFARTRNPMYLALLIALIGWGCFLANPFSLALSPLFAAYLNRFQIRPEERALQAAFGAEFTAYRRAVRRWL